MKTLSIYNTEYGQAYFNGNKLVGYTHENDANWRAEYFNPIMKEMGIKVVWLDKLNKVQRDQIEGDM